MVISRGGGGGGGGGANAARELGKFSAKGVFSQWGKQKKGFGFLLERRGLRGCTENFGSGSGILKPKSGFKQWQLAVTHGNGGGVRCALRVCCTQPYSASTRGSLTLTVSDV